MGVTKFFLHGLESSGNGTKGRWFGEYFPDMIRPDFTGTLYERVNALEKLCATEKKLLFVGSSFGGLMATVFAMKNPGVCTKLILLAPALNFEEFTPPPEQISVPTLLVIGRYDDVTPPDIVLPQAKETFNNLEIIVEEDDHMLHKTFHKMDWKTLLS
jgi:pimeloyl-ACP methyl ester carboxylesterase